MNEPKRTEVLQMLIFKKSSLSMTVAAAVVAVAAAVVAVAAVAAAVVVAVEAIAIIEVVGKPILVEHVRSAAAAAAAAAALVTSLAASPLD